MNKQLFCSEKLIIYLHVPSHDPYLLGISDKAHWGSGYQTHRVFKWLKVVWLLNDPLTKRHLSSGKFFCPLFRQSPLKFWSTIQITIQTVDVLNSRHLFVHYLNVSVIRMSSIRIPTVSEFLFLTRAEIHQVRLSNFSTCRFFIEKLPKIKTLGNLRGWGKRTETNHRVI